MLLIAGVAIYYAPATPKPLPAIELPEQPRVEYKFLGTVDGCKLYYVAPSSSLHAGSDFHFVKCGESQTVSTSRRVSCGKACTREIETTTVIGEQP